MAVADLLLVIAPEFDSLDSGVRDGAIDIAEQQVGPKFPNRETAVAYVTAHILTLRSRKGVAGALSTLKEGDLAASFGTVGGVVGMSEWHTTVYGQEYERLKRLFIFAPRTRVSHA